ncbi:hypothetical protein [Halodesulfovibrio aestuarii]|uniref:hypothetical protein n=1 Tax=Halodesulfovibrio aestuarii TaxID=126333 RepID=UPI00048537DA
MEHWFRKEKSGMVGTIFCTGASKIFWAGGNQGMRGNGALIGNPKKTQRMSLGGVTKQGILIAVPAGCIGKKFAVEAVDE